MNTARFRRDVAIAYVASALLTCIVVAAMPGSVPYRITKVLPLLMLSVLRFREKGDHLSKYVGFGLWASFLGDVVIDSSFIAGLGAFLVGHVCYVVAMGRPFRHFGAWLAMSPAVMFGGGMYSLLVASGRAPEPLQIPVTVYMLVISTMFGRAMMRAFVEKKDRAAIVFLVGAVLFVISDSLIGINRWVTPVPLARVWIMATYYAGQWGIFSGSKATQTI